MFNDWCKNNTFRLTFQKFDTAFYRKRYYLFLILLLCLGIFFKYSGKIKFYGDTTIFYALFVIFSFIGVVINFNKLKNLYFNKVYIGYYILLLLFLVLISASLLYTPSNIYGQAKWILTMSFGMVALMSFVIAKEDEWLPILYILALAIIIVVIITFGNPITTMLSADQRFRLGWKNGGMHPIIVARGLCLAILIMSTVGLKRDKSNLSKALNLTFVFTGVLYVILTGSKGPLVALLLALVSYYFGKWTTKKHRARVLGLVSLFFLGVVVLFGFKDYFKGTFFAYRFLDNVLSYSLRWEQYKLLLSAYADFDFVSMIFGDGYGSFSQLLYNKDVRGFPHNIFLEILYELGLVGLAIFSLLVAIPFKYYNKLTDVGKVHFSIMFYFLINALVTGDVPANGLYFIFATLTLFSLNLSRRPIHKSIKNL